MEEQNRILNTGKTAETPREVVLRYEAPGPREVVERYVPPEPAAGGRKAVSAEKPAPAYTPGLGAPERGGSRIGLWIFLSCLGVVFVAACVLGVLHWRGVLPLSRAQEQRDYFEYERRGETAEYSDAETTIRRYANGDGTRLRYAETHGSVLSIQDVYKRVNPCTVTIATSLPDGGALIGAGVIFTENGYILTNAHLLVGGRECFVVLDAGTSYDAKLVGYDAEQDLAVIKIDAHNLPAAEFGDSDALTVGDTVYAIGHPLGVELRGTLTDGIVSAINRDVMVDGVLMTLIQTNAALNNGNSGGPLINIYGQVVGINTMKMGSSRAANVEGLGFAIPISAAAWMADDLIAYGELHGEPVLGISVRREPVVLETGETALEILELVPNGPGEAAGLEPGDRVVRADNDPVESVNDLLRARRRYGVGDTLTLEISRGGERFTVGVVLAQAES